MNRRELLTRLGFVGAVTPFAGLPESQQGFAGQREQSSNLPYDRPIAQCPRCHDHMLIIELSNESNVWTCFRCKRAWRIPNTLLHAVEVPYEETDRTRNLLTRRT